MYEPLSYLGQVTPSTPPSSLFSVLIFRFPVSVPNWLMGWMTHSHWRAGGLNPSVCSCDGRIGTQFWLQFWKSILDLSSLSHPHYSRNTLLTSRKMRWKALHTSRCPISLSHRFPYWNFSRHPTRLKKKKKIRLKNQTPFSFFKTKQNKNVSCDFQPWHQFFNFGFHSGGMQPTITMTTAASVQIHHLTGSPEHTSFPLSL